MNYKITEQNEEYSQQASQKARSPHQRPSNLFGHKEENKTIQIKSLLKQAEHNNKEGSFKARNASAYQIAISKSGKVISGIARVLSSSSMSLNSNFQKNNFSDKSTSLLAPLSRDNHKNLKKPGSIKIKKSKSAFKKIIDSFKTLRSTKQVSVYPKKVEPNPYVKNPDYNTSRVQPPQNSNPSNQSLSPSQIQKSLFGRDRRLKSADPLQRSPLSRNPQQPRRNGGVDNRRPGPAPRQPLSATRTNSRGTHVGPDSRYAR